MDTIDRLLCITFGSHQDAVDVYLTLKKLLENEYKIDPDDYKVQWDDVFFITLSKEYSSEINSTIEKINTLLSKKRPVKDIVNELKAEETLTKKDMEDGLMTVFDEDDESITALLSNKNQIDKLLSELENMQN